MRKILLLAFMIVFLAAFAGAHDMIARQYLAASFGGVVGSLAGAALGGFIGRAVDPAWGDLTGIIIGYIFGAPLGSVIASTAWAASNNMDGSIPLSAVGGFVGMGATFALNGLSANIFPANNWNPSGLILLVSLPFCSAKGAVIGYNYPKLLSGLTLDGRVLPAP